ncbi:hypothetical protein [Angelakisella massiliensis]|uniref:hypothetical protein n=1 Tax=Angelakisella massiliensis TaxID=1871018 RepID=UPI0023A8FAEA|nr:hypothetical protein [Angelakisella massiliensis]
MIHQQAPFCLNPRFGERPSKIPETRKTAPLNVSIIYMQPNRRSAVLIHQYAYIMATFAPDCNPQTGTFEGGTESSFIFHDFFSPWEKEIHLFTKFCLFVHKKARFLLVFSNAICYNMQ